MNYKEWSETTEYQYGNYVVYNGLIYKANYWTKGDNPETSNVWIYIGVYNTTSTESVINANYDFDVIVNDLRTLSLVQTFILSVMMGLVFLIVFIKGWKHV